MTRNVFKSRRTGTPAIRDTHAAVAAIRLQLATELEVLSGAARIEAAREACTRTGGTFTAPNLCGDWGSHWAEISLLGITYQGNDEEHAVAGWISAVIRVANAIEEEVAA